MLRTMDMVHSYHPDVTFKAKKQPERSTPQSSRTRTNSTSSRTVISHSSMDCDNEYPASSSSILDEFHSTSEYTDKATTSRPNPKGNCNPLPGWLMNTFKNLVHTHPLRLLLPQVFDEEVLQNELNPRSRTGSPAVATEADKDKIFAFDPFEVAQESRQKVPYPGEADLKPTTPMVTGIYDNQGHSQAIRQNARYQNASLETGFSTPGPIFTGPSPFSSRPRVPRVLPTPYAVQHSPMISEDRNRFESPCKTTRGLQLHYSKDDGLSVVDDTELEYFSHIYAAPGPASSITGTDFSEYEDDLGTELTQEASDFDDLSPLAFKWTKFDRNEIIAPDLPRRPIYQLEPERSVSDACQLIGIGHLERSSAKDRAYSPEPTNKFVDDNFDEAPAPFSDGRDIDPVSAINQEDSSDDDGFAQSALLLSAKKEYSATAVPKPTFAPAPGIFISPLKSTDPEPLPGTSKPDYSSQESDDSIHSWSEPAECMPLGHKTHTIV